MEERANTILCRAIVLNLVLLLVIALSVRGDPTAPTSITASPGSTRSVTGTQTVAAVAGNITQLTINGTTQTSTWQGYYGNISGQITLDDSMNRTFYDWNLAVVKGEIYASRGQVNWNSISCLNYTNDGTTQLNLSLEEDNLSISLSDSDGVDETFSDINTHPLFYVGGRTINADTCPATNLYVNDQQSPDRFYEVLLQDNSYVVYTALLENSQTGFDGNPWDFQLMVGENGHGNNAATSYYFYVELG